MSAHPASLRLALAHGPLAAALVAVFAVILAIILAAAAAFMVLARLVGGRRFFRRFLSRAGQGEITRLALRLRQSIL